MPTYPISLPADNAAPYTYTQPIRDSIAAVNDHQTRVTALEGSSSATRETVLAPAPSGGDDLATLQALVPTRGVLQLRTGNYQLSGMLTIGSGQDLRGTGGNLMDPPTTLTCTAAGAGVKFTEAGGVSGYFHVNGNSIATLPFQRILVTDAAYRTFVDLTVELSAQDNMQITAAQNDLWMSIVSRHAVRDNIYIDKGYGGSLFIRVETDEPGRYGMRIDNALGAGPGGYNRPTHLSFYHCIFERAWSGHGTVSQLYLKNCELVQFRDCVVYGGTEMTGPLIDVYSPTRILFSAGIINGPSTTAVTGLRLDDGAQVVLSDTVRFENLLNGISLGTGTPSVRVLGNIFWNSVANRYVGTGAGNSDDTVVFDLDHAIRVFRDATGNTAFASYVRGEAGVRFQVNGDGSIGFNDGVGYTPKATLSSGGSNILTMPAAQVLKTGRGATASRPSATTVGAGAQWYDTTIGKPIWSNGSVWKDAAGTTV